MHLLLVLSPNAAALPSYSSDPQPVVLTDDVPVFDVLSVDTGLLPGGVSPASVRFFVSPSGGVSTALQATSFVAWPEAILHNVQGVPGTGTFTLDGGIDLQAEVFIDLGFIYKGTIPIYVDAIPFMDERRFEPLSLGGETVRVSGDATLLPPLEIPLPVTDVVDAYLAVEAYPDVSATLTPLGVVTYHEDGTFHPQLSEGDAIILPVPSDRESLELQTAFVSEVRSEMELVLEARVEVDTFLGPFTVFTFPIPLTLVDAVEPRVSELALYSHPLPAIAVGAEVLDFGRVAVGQSVALELAVDNIGRRALGTEAFLGAGDFELHPESAVLQPDEGGIYTITFTPTEPGPVTSQVWIDSTDPGVPTVEVQLIASAQVPETVTDATGDGSTTTGSAGPSAPGGGDASGSASNGAESPRWDAEPTGTCGCTSSPSGGALGWVLWVGLLVRRRSHR